MQAFVEVKCVLELRPPDRSGGCRQREKRGDPGDGEGWRWSCPGPVQRPATISGRQQLLLKRGGGGRSESFPALFTEMCAGCSGGDSGGGLMQQHSSAFCGVLMCVCVSVLL